MSIATLDRPRTGLRHPIAAHPAPVRHLHRVAPVAPVTATPPAPVAVAPAPTPVAPTRSTRRIAPAGAEARGFALYVGIDEEAAIAAGTSLAEVVEQLKALAAQLVPTAESHASVALAPEGAGGRDVDVVRLALRDPAVQQRRAQVDEQPSQTGIVVDLTRKRVVLDDETLGLTYKEFELLQYLVLREGRTIERTEIIASLWGEGDEEAPNERTIDVHVRRLRAKLGAYGEIVRTVRGAGYRFDRHADVTVRRAHAPSPDLF